MFCSLFCIYIFASCCFLKSALQNSHATCCRACFVVWQARPYFFSFGFVRKMVKKSKQFHKKWSLLHQEGKRKMLRYQFTVLPYRIPFQNFKVTTQHTGYLHLSHPRPLRFLQEFAFNGKILAVGDRCTFPSRSDITGAFIGVYHWSDKWI